MMSKLSRRAALAALAALGSTAMSASSVLAAPPPPAVLSADDNERVNRAVAYLQGLSTAKGRFIQTDARGGVSQGTFLLQRPGRARFAYDPPSGLVMASDGSLVAVLNSRLKTYEAYPLGATPLSLFLAREIRLDRGVRVSRVLSVADGFSIVASDARKKTQGSLTLTFSEAPMRLQGWTITDAQGQSTRVRLVDFAPSPPVDKSLFVLKDPRPRVTPHR